MLELSVIMPTYQSRRLAEANSSELARFLTGLEISFEILLVDDASRPEERPRAFKLAKACRLITLPQNLGKGGAVRVGLDAARGKYLCFFDVDLPFHLKCFAQAIKEFRNGATMVAGDRRHPRSTRRRRLPWSRSIASQFFSWGATAALGQNVNDTQCGFKGITARAWRDLRSVSAVRGFSFDLEWFAAAEANGWLVARIPVTSREPKQSSVSLWREWLPTLRDLVAVSGKRRAGSYRVKTAKRKLKKAG